MKSVLALGAFLLIGSANAAFKPFSKPGYDLKISLALDGANVATPQVSVRSGEAATIFKETNKKEYFVEVVTTEGLGLGGIKMNFVVGTIDSDGHRTVVARPSIEAHENERANFSVSGLDGVENLSLSILAKKVEL